MIRNRWPIAVLLLLALMIGVSVQAVGAPGGQTSYLHTTPPGDSAYADPTPPADAHLLGEGKGDNLVSLAAKVFHRNLRNYQYVGFETLWRDPTPEEQIALKDLLIDEFVAVQAGDYLPLGYLYQGTEAYTIVEQPDGSLTLTQYALTPVEEWKQLDNPADVPLYREVSSENQMVPASVSKSLYA